LPEAGPAANREGLVADALASIVRTIDAALRAGRSPTRVGGVRAGAAALILARLLEEAPRPVVVLTADDAAAARIAADLGFLLGEAGASTPLVRRLHVLPAWDVPPFEPLSPSRDVVAARIEGLHHLAQTRDPVIVTTVPAWAQRTLPRAALAAATRYLVRGEVVAPEELAAHLIEWGYHRVPLAQDPGDVAVRGGVLDVFPVGHAAPVRLEFFGDEIESLRTFDADSQRSTGAIEDVLLLPAAELPRSRLAADLARRVDERAADVAMARRDRKALVDAVRAGVPFPGVERLLPLAWDALDALVDHLPPSALVWVHGGAEVEAAIEATSDEVARHAAASAERGGFHPVPGALYLDAGAMRARLAASRVVETNALEVLASTTIGAKTYAADHAALRPTVDPERPYAPVAARLRELAAAARVVVVAETAARRDRVVELLGGFDVAVSVRDGPGLALLADRTPGIVATLGGLCSPVWWPDAGLALIDDTAILGEPPPIRRRRRGRVDDWLSSLAELSADDFVVHVDHGIAIYRGLRHVTVGETAGDYLHLEYAGGDRLYVPVDRIGAVQRYVGADGAAPALDKLGGTSWERTKAKAKESLLAMASELIALHATREAHGRARYAVADRGYDEFCRRFPFEETPDQQAAIEAVLADLQSDRPMDRLVCGDVGFGKTEVALRAAYLAVMAARQVAVLVPTTLLAQQHAETLRLRFRELPVVVEELSRFRTAAENRATLAGLAAGTVDVVVGTQRLLQKDVAFRDLGLLVIDEEHRFGVRDKERIRAMRATVDVLTLTATPIPRTLNMALSGIRDLSVIATAPVDRLAIRTYVTRFDDGVVRDAVLRELARGGQVFFVHNRVETIERRAADLRTIVPEASIAVAHGQMGERALERTMLAFVHGDANLLVTSAIIESGLDIPSANTLIVDRADTFGLAQLYQIRGRVGRSGRRAYAYLLVPAEHRITEDARKRLQVLQELDDLGGGFRLAVHDLEIRGAGNLLGKQQSGNIAAVGLELYTHMMEQAVAEARGTASEPSCDPEIQLGIAAYVPDDYVADVHQRLGLYKRLADVAGDEDLAAIADELRDRYGPHPETVRVLVAVMGLRSHLRALRIVRARRRGGAVVLDFDERTPIAVARLLAIVEAHGARVRLAGPTTLEVRTSATEPLALVAEVRDVLRSLEAA
jgi:transcription-repair coupling factor (superfamily II helicase)